MNSGSTKFFKSIYNQPESQSKMRIQNFLYHVIHLQSLNQISLDQILQFLKTIKSENIFPEKMFIENLWLIGYEIDKLEKVEKSAKEQKKNYVNLIQQIEITGLIHKNILIERLDDSQLTESNLIDYNKFTKQRNRVNTRIHFEQQKFNLFREENEGYSKLVIELLDEEITSTEKGVELTENILGLIGHFDLDPNRVLDTLLDRFQLSPLNRHYIPLILNFKRESIPHLLGFKFSQYNKDANGQIQLRQLPYYLQRHFEQKIIINQNQKHQQQQQLTPWNLCLMSSVLLKSGIVSIEELWCHLMPTDHEQESMALKKEQIAAKIFKNVFLVKLKQEEIDKKREKQIETQELEELNNQFIFNQKMWLMTALLQINHFDLFEKLYLMQQQYMDPLSSFKPMLTTLFNLLNWMIKPMDSVCQVSRFLSNVQNINNITFQYDENIKENHKQIRQFDNYQDIDFYYMLSRVMNIIGIQIGDEPIIYSKLCRILKQYLKNPNKDISSNNIIMKIIEEIMGKYLLPAISVQKCNPGQVAEFWLVWKQFEYNIRYNYYEQLITTGLFSNTNLIISTGFIIKEIKRWLKKLTKDKIKQNSRSLGKITHNNSLFLLNEIIKTIKSYPNQIQPMIQSLNCCSPFTLDCLLFIILRQISDQSKAKLNEEDANYEQWLTNLALFAGSFLKKQYEVDLTGVFIYLCNQLASENSLDLILLKEIMVKMSGCDFVENLNIDQLLAQAGGPNLQMESSSLTSDFKSAKRSANALENFFWKKTIRYCTIVNPETGELENVSLVFVLMTLLLQQRSNILYTTVISQPKLQGMLFDKINDIFIQFMQFFKFQMDSYNHYQQLFPKNVYRRLVLDYKISSDIALHLTRTTFKPVYKMNDSEFNEMVTYLVDVQKKTEYNKTKRFKEYQNGLTPTYFAQELQENFFHEMTTEFYTIFWLLTLDKIYVPTERYDFEIDKLTKEQNKLENLKGSDQQSSSKQGKNKLDKEIDKTKNIIEKLKKEKDNLLKIKEEVEKFLMDKSELLTLQTYKKLYSHSIIQYCIYPRILIEPCEAIFSAKFLEIVYKVKRYTYRQFVDAIHQLTLSIIPTLQCCSQREATNISIFFFELFTYLQNWNDEQKFRQDFKQFHGWETVDVLKIKLGILTTYQKIVQILKLFNAEGYMQSRNTLIFLDKTKQFFPAIRKHADSILKHIIEKIIKNSGKEMEDLNLAAQSYEKMLKGKIAVLPEVDMAMLNKEYKANLEKIKRRGAEREREKTMKIEESHSKYRHNEEKMKRSRKELKDSELEKKNSKERNKKHERIEENDQQQQQSQHQQHQQSSEQKKRKDEIKEKHSEPQQSTQFQQLQDIKQAIQQKKNEKDKKNEKAKHKEEQDRVEKSASRKDK